MTKPQTKFNQNNLWGKDMQKIKNYLFYEDTEFSQKRDRYEHGVFFPTTYKSNMYFLI